MAARSAEPAAAELTPPRRALLNRRVRLLVATTITYNVIEAIVAIGAGAAASSTALLGFGLDSVIEVASASAAALVIAAVALKEGRAAWRGHYCC
jgi:hypothetical protein